MFDWMIAQMEREVSNGGVIVSHWRVTATEVDGENTYTASAYGSCGFTPDPSAPDFVPYDQLTQEMVLNWVWGVEDKAEIEAKLTAKIEDEKSPKVEAGVPW
jgi:hypothetical protein